MYKTHLGLTCKFIIYAKVKKVIFVSSFAPSGDTAPAFLKPFMKTKAPNFVFIVRESINETKKFSRLWVERKSTKAS